MKLVKLPEVIQMLETLESEYARLKGLIQDQVHDDQIDEAIGSFDKLLDIKKAIEQVKDLDVQVEQFDQSIELNTN